MKISPVVFSCFKTSSRKDRAICDLKDCCEYVSCNNSNNWWNVAFVAFVRPLMPLVGNNPQQDIVEYYDIYQTLGPILYLAAMGLILDYLHPFYFFWVMDCILYARSLCSTCNFFWFIMDYYQLLIFAERVGYLESYECSKNAQNDG